MESTERREATYDVVWPRSPRGVQSRRSAPRLRSLERRRVAFLWDHVFRGDEVFPMLGAALERACPGVEIIGHDVFGNTHGSDEKEMIDRLPDALRDRGVDAVVSGMGC